MSYNGQDRRRFNWYPIVGYVILLVALVGALYMVQGSAIERERQAQLVQCARVQLLRDQTNGVNFVIYDTFKQVVEQQTAAIESGKLEGVALKQAKDSRERSLNVVENSVVTGPTDCHLAVNEPTTYKAPAPRFINEGGDQIAVARKRADSIIEKAKTNSPLYEGIPEDALAP